MSYRIRTKISAGVLGLLLSWPLLAAEQTSEVTVGVLRSLR